MELCGCCWLDGADVDRNFALLLLLANELEELSNGCRIDDDADVDDAVPSPYIEKLVNFGFLLGDDELLN